MIPKRQPIPIAHLYPAISSALYPPPTAQSTVKRDREYALPPDPEYALPITISIIWSPGSLRDPPEWELPYWVLDWATGELANLFGWLPLNINLSDLELADAGMSELPYRDGLTRMVPHWEFVAVKYLGPEQVESAMDTIEHSDSPLGQFGVDGGEYLLYVTAPELLGELEVLE
jgi:hypothetical protein